MKKVFHKVCKNIGDSVDVDLLLLQSAICGYSVFGPCFVIQYFVSV